MVAISCTSCLVSLAFVDFDRKRLNFARRQGCVDTWTLEGTDEAMIDGGDRMGKTVWMYVMIWRQGLIFVDEQQMGRRVLAQIHNASCLLLRGDP